MPSAEAFCRPALRSDIQVNSVAFVVAAGFDDDDDDEGTLVDGEELSSGNGIGQQHPATVNSISIDIASTTAKRMFMLMFSV